MTYRIWCCDCPWEGYRHKPELAQRHRCPACNSRNLKTERHRHEAKAE